MRITIICAAASAFVCGATAASPAWQEVSLQNNITVEVPAAAGAGYLPTKDAAASGALMTFMLPGNGEAAGCWLSRMPYSATFTRKIAIDHLKVKERICNSFNSDAGKVHVLNWGPKSSNGQPSAGCAFSYTLSKGTLSAGTNQNLMVAAPENAYLLLCLVRAQSQGEAEKRWKTTWARSFAHIEASLRLAKRT